MATSLSRNDAKETIMSSSDQLCEAKLMHKKMLNMTTIDRV